MASYFLSQNPTVANFRLTPNQNADVFIVDTGVASSRLRILQSGANVVITDGARTATLQSFAIAQITSAQFTNNDGSRIIIGDDQVSVTGDAGPNGATMTGLATGGGDLLIGLGGSDGNFNAPDNDTVVDGGGGNDFIVGNAGNDVIQGTGASGNDTVLGGQGDDNIQYQGNTAGNTLISGNLGDDILVGGDFNDTIFGGQGNDQLFSDGLAETAAVTNLLDGGLGLDLLVGGGGNDTLRGGDGEDTLFGGAGGTDVLSGQQGDDIINADGTNDTVFGGQGADIVGIATMATVVFLNLGNDSVAGGAGNDSINGGQGNDTIQGGAGGDSLAGGLGNDVFVERTDNRNAAAPPTDGDTTSGLASDLADTITDFVSGSDQIRSFINTLIPTTGSAGSSAGTAGNYREYADASVTSVASAIASYEAATNTMSNYTFIVGATDGYLIIDSGAANLAATDDTLTPGFGAADKVADGVIKLTALNGLGGFDFTDIV